MVLLAPGISGYPYPDEPELDERWTALTEAGDLDGLTQLYLDMWCPAGHDPLVREMMAASTATEAVEEQFVQRLEPVWERLGEIAVPTTIMIGDLDPASVIE
jgi:3-oxoadipate enol-lactonase